LENLFGRTVEHMTTADEVREFLCAVPRTHTDTRDTWLRRAGAFLGLTPRRARSVWYREKVRIDHDEYLRMRARMEQLKEAQLKRQEILRDVDALLGSASGVACAPPRSVSDIGAGEVRESGEAPGRPGRPIR
jgi:hypothetical protein